MDKAENIAKSDEKSRAEFRRFFLISSLANLFGLGFIVATLDISRRGIIPWVTNQQRYILSIEAALFAVLLTETLAKIVSYGKRTPEVINFNVRLRLLVRVIGYLISILSIVSILASNPVLAISVGAIVGVVIAFATQNITGSILAAVLILHTDVIHVGEEITFKDVTGLVADITLIHTVLSVGDDVIFVPNSEIMVNAVIRKKRHGHRASITRGW